MWIVAVTILVTDLSVATVDHDLALVAAGDDATSFFSRSLGSVVGDRGTSLWLDLPGRFSRVRLPTGDDVDVGFLCHVRIPWYSRQLLA